MTFLNKKKYEKKFTEIDHVEEEDFFSHHEDELIIMDNNHDRTFEI
jgi:hypothetical protein